VPEAARETDTRPSNVATISMLFSISRINWGLDMQKVRVNCVAWRMEDEEQPIYRRKVWKDMRKVSTKGD
jgi:hypothetical protein